MTDYDKKVLVNILKTVEINKTLINAFDFIPSALNFQNSKTNIINQIIKDGEITPENKKLFTDTGAIFDKKAETFIKCINNNIIKFDKKKSNLTKYINLVLYKNREVLMLPEEMVNFLRKNIAGTDGSNRSSGTTSKKVDLTYIVDTGISNLNMLVIFRYVKIIFTVVPFESIISFATNSFILDKLRTYAAVFGGDYNNILIMSEKLEGELCLASQYNSNEFISIIEKIKGYLNLNIYVDKRTKIFASSQLYELQILYTVCLRMLSFLISTIDIESLPKEIIEFNKDTQVFNIKKSVLLLSKDHINTIKELFSIKFPSKNTISIYIFNISLLILHSIFTSILQISSDLRPRGLLRQDATHHNPTQTRTRTRRPL